MNTVFPVFPSPLRSDEPFPIPPAHAPFSVPALKPFPDRLYVVAVISNPVRYRSRYRLYRSFVKHVEDAGAILFTVEMAFGDRPFEVTEAGNPNCLQLRSAHELWHKENMINLGIARLPAEANYVAWVDADVEFARSDWAQETIQQLQHYEVVQMFSQSVDLGPNHEMVESAVGWVESIRRGYMFRGPGGSRPGNRPADYGVRTIQVPQKGVYVRGAWHSGLAWAARKSAFNKMGGLIDVAILGSADRNMAAGFFGFMTDTIDPTFSPAYKTALLDWQERTEKNIRRNVGQVEGLITHYFHGRKAQRGYTSRWKILSNYQFDPYTDLMRDYQGLWQLRDHGDERSIRLRDAIRNYFRERNEDGTEL